MATNLDATKMKQDFQLEQSILMARARRTAFARTTTISALIGALLICLSLFQIPNNDCGHPLPLNHEILYAFAAAIVVGILLNLSVFLMHFLSRINERKLNKMEPPSVELIQKCFNTQKKLIKAIQVTEASIFILGSLFSVCVLMTGFLATFSPNGDVTAFTGTSARILQSASTVLAGLRIIIIGVPGLD